MALHPDTMMAMTFPSWTDVIGILVDTVKNIGSEERSDDGNSEEKHQPEHGFTPQEGEEETSSSRPFVGAVRYLKSNNGTLPVALRQLDEPVSQEDEAVRQEDKPQIQVPDFVPYKERPPPTPVDAILLFFALQGLLHLRALEAFKLVKGPEYKQTSTLGKKENSWLDAQIQVLSASTQIPVPSTDLQKEESGVPAALLPTPKPSEPAAAYSKLSFGSVRRAFLPQKENSEKAPKKKSKRAPPIAIQGRIGIRTIRGGKAERADNQKQWNSAYGIIRGTSLEVYDLPYKEEEPPLHKLEIGMYQLFALCPDEGRRLGIFRLVRAPNDKPPITSYDDEFVLTLSPRSYHQSSRPYLRERSSEPTASRLGTDRCYDGSLLGRIAPDPFQDCATACLM